MPVAERPKTQKEKASVMRETADRANSLHCECTINVIALYIY